MRYTLTALQEARKQKAAANEEHFRWLVVLSQYSLAGTTNDSGMLGSRLSPVRHALFKNVRTSLPGCPQLPAWRQATTKSQLAVDAASTVERDSSTASWNFDSKLASSD